jgi:hypothetical protein
MPDSAIHIERDQNLWIDRARAYKVVIDDQPMGEIRRGQSAEFVLPPGPHELSLRIDWTRSEMIVLDLTSGQDAYFQCGPSRPLFFGQLLGILRIRPYLSLRLTGSGDGRPTT